MIHKRNQCSHCDRLGLPSSKINSGHAFSTVFNDIFVIFKIGILNQNVFLDIVSCELKA